MQEVTIKKIYINDKSKDGKPFVTRDGRPYKKIALKTEEYPDKYITGFHNDTTELWKEGDKVSILIEENGQYLNFKLPNKTDELEGRVKVLEGQVKVLQALLMGRGEAVQAEPAMDVDTIPF